MIHELDINNSALVDKINSFEQFRAFNDLANFHGLKTGFRTVISADQIKVAQKDGSQSPLTASQTMAWDAS